MILKKIIFLTLTISSTFTSCNETTIKNSILKHIHQILENEPDNSFIKIYKQLAEDGVHSFFSPEVNTFVDKTKEQAAIFIKKYPQVTDRSEDFLKTVALCSLNTINILGLYLDDFSHILIKAYVRTVFELCEEHKECSFDISLHNQEIPLQFYACIFLLLQQEFNQD